MFKHRGKSLVLIGGLGFPDRPYTIRKMAMAKLRSDSKRGGLTVMPGGPIPRAGWHPGCRAVPDGQPVYRMADIISPWAVSRYRNAGQARTHAKNRAKEDRAWCEVHGKDCRPLREHPKTEAK